MNEVTPVRFGAGLHPNLSHADYHADPCAEPSLTAGLAHTLTSFSPAHAWAQCVRNPAARPKPATRSMDGGSAFHELLLGEGGGIVEIDAENFKTKAAQEARDAAQAAGKTPILAPELARLRAKVAIIEERLAGHAMLRDLAGEDLRHPEASMIWRQDGTWCRARPDVLIPRLGLVCDFKFTGKPAIAWPKGAFDRGDHIRAAHYIAGMRAVLDVRDCRYLFVVIESDEPHGIVVHEMSGAALHMGATAQARAAVAWRRGVTTGEWPCYPQMVNTIDVPSWAFDPYEEGDEAA